MILKYILFKKFILQTIKNKFNIINFILFFKQIVILYIISYKQTILNSQWLIINHLNNFNNNLKILNFFTNIPYISNKKIDNFLNNWKILKQQLFLLKWTVYLIYLININQLKLPFNNIIKLFKKFIFLKKNYWTIFKLNNPSHILIISKEFKYKLFNIYKKLNQQIFFITDTSNCISHNMSIIQIPNYYCLPLILELIITANIQGKLFITRTK